MSADIVCHRIFLLSRFRCGFRGHATSADAHRAGLNLRATELLVRTLESDRISAPRRAAPRRCGGATGSL
jgi:hypothetical protein